MPDNIQHTTAHQRNNKPSVAVEFSPPRRWHGTARALMAVQLALPVGSVFTPALAATATKSSFLTSAPAGNNFAQIAPMTASTPTDGNPGGAAAPMARAAAVGQAGRAGEQWLSQFGTARVQLNLDEKFKLDNSAVDVLVPLYDTPKNTLFTQMGARNKDNRNTVNVGVGLRTQQGGWMYGANTFHDLDLTGKNRRVGVGGEAWSDYLKLSANGYLGLSDWRQSRDFADYRERPANGFDLRAEAWLPSYPQLGGKLMYEQYRGNDVALFGKNNRQKDPYALTANINYTPIPLLTVGGEHRTGKNGVNDSNINFQLNYRLGESWKSHLDPAKIAASRTLAGSLHDLVERNNHIVMNYQKQESVRLTMPAQLTGSGGQTLTLKAEVSAQNGLKQLEWDAAALIAAGGVITQTSPQSLAVTLPAHRGDAGNDHYTVNAAAHDRKGNVSNRASTTITVNAPEKVPETEPETKPETETPATVISNFAVVGNHAPADGKSVNRVRAMVKDANGKPVAGEDVTFSADNGAALQANVVKSDDQGRVETGLTQMTAGVTTVSARVGNDLQQVETVFVAMEAVQINTTVELLTTGDKIANGSQAHQVKITVRDAGNNPLPGKEVSFSPVGEGKISAGGASTGPDGTLMAEVTSTKAGGVSVTAKVQGIEKTSGEMRFVAGPADENTSSLRMLTSGWVIPNGTSAHRMEVKLRDAFSNPVPGQSVSFAFKASNDSAAITTSTDATQADGTIVASVTSQKPQTVVVNASVGHFSFATPNMVFSDATQPCNGQPWCVPPP